MTKIIAPIAVKILFARGHAEQKDCNGKRELAPK